MTTTQKKMTETGETFRPQTESSASESNKEKPGLNSLQGLQESLCNKDQLVAEMKVLRQRLEELEGIEQRCRQAETALQTLESRNRLLGDSAPLGILIIDIQGRITGINRKMQALSALLTGKKSTATVPPDSQAFIPSNIMINIQQCIFHQRSCITEHSAMSPTGCRTHLRYYLSPIPGIDGIGTEVMAFVEDCTDLKKTALAQRMSEERYRRLYQSAPIAMIERDVTLLYAHLEQLRTQGISDLREYLGQNPNQIYHCWSLIKTIDHNLAFSELMGFGNDALPRDFFATDSPIFREMACEIILTISRKKSINQRELTVVTASGQIKFVFGTSMVISGSEEGMVRVVVAMVDISERRKAEEILRISERRFKEQSLRDNLTGLFNQRYLYQSLAELIESAKTNDTLISLIFMDLDHFKQVVDTHGHLNGSRAIREVAQTIKSCLHEPAYAVAYAGDEFVVVLPGCNASQAFQKASEIQGRMKGTEYVLDQGIAVRLEASFGIATFPDDGADTAAFIAAADQALFAVKETGKNDIGRYKPPPTETALKLLCDNFY